MENIIKDYIEVKNYSAIKKALEDMLPADIAELLEELDTKNSLLVFRMLHKDVAVEVFAHLSVKQQTSFTLMIKEDELKEILEELYFDDKIDYLEEMPSSVVKKILKYSPETERKLINQFLNYPENSAGSLMTIELVDLKKELTIDEALLRIRRTALDKETIYTCYVTDSNRKLEGTVSLKDLVIAPGNKKVEDIMETDPIFVRTIDDQEEVANLFKKYDLLSVPVVDQENRLIGIITIDDIVDVIEEEASEDIQIMHGLAPSEEEYLKTDIITLAKQRIFWLLFLMLSATITGNIIESFQGSLEKAVGLAVFIPMLMGTGGNAGTQSSTLVIRGIALGEVVLSDISKVIWRELRISLMVGISLAVVNFVRVYYLGGNSFTVSVVVSVTLILTIMIAKVIGGVLPLIAKAINIDPAIMASPLISTIVDALTLLSYFKIAEAIMHI
ncbi:MAG TPA: magnesium transporter [Bacillota bacterium]|nr:magnesium transporter [Bacillota bacterium]HNT03898.1 magnesium transporter [Bacillota bacterium]HPA54644.1 magnesium transporter [Bacillota bacterium]HPX68312.1 magnesium transporter [Bacillota bacterium]HQA64584.1 magnesium transporter [Bacillota bacterium]